MDADPEELRSLGRAIVDSSLYMMLATADASGRPWATPVYFAPEACRSFLWVSRPDARHSRNLAASTSHDIAPDRQRSPSLDLEDALV